MTAPEACFTPATELAAALAAGSSPPSSSLDAILARIERPDPEAQRLRPSARGRAREAARTTDTDRARSPRYLRAAHGLPFTAQGPDAHPGHPDDLRLEGAGGERSRRRLGVSVDRLLAVGGIFFGKTTTARAREQGPLRRPAVRRRPQSLAVDARARRIERARRPPSRRASGRSPKAVTRRARSGCRRAAAASSGSSRPSGASPTPRDSARSSR